MRLGWTSADVDSALNYRCRLIPTTDWSGVLDNSICRLTVINGWYNDLLNVAETIANIGREASQYLGDPQAGEDDAAKVYAMSEYIREGVNTLQDSVMQLRQIANRVPSDQWSSQAQAMSDGLEQLAIRAYSVRVNFQDFASKYGAYAIDEVHGSASDIVAAIGNLISDLPSLDTVLADLNKIAGSIGDAAARLLAGVGKGVGEGLAWILIPIVGLLILLNKTGTVDTRAMSRAAAHAA